MAIHLMSIRIQTCGRSHIGLVRQNNEDVWAELPEEHFYVLADGMGGHQAGEVAAKEAVNSLCRHMKKVLKSDGKKHKSLLEIKKALIDGIERANEKIYLISKDTETLRGMGTTLCCLCIHEDAVLYAHVGDSRIYRLRNKKLSLLTKDHSLLRELMEMGQISEVQASEFLYKNIITKAIGTEALVEPAVDVADIQAGDVYLICSDGLTDLLSLEDIQAILNQQPDPALSTQALIDEAIARGGHDNVTVVVVALNKK